MVLKGDNMKCQVCFKEVPALRTYRNLEVCPPCCAEDEKRVALSEIKPLVDALFNAANHDRNNGGAFVESVMRQHRTLQQSFFIWLVQLINAYSKLEPAWYDLRNEDAVKACKELAPILKDKYFRYI